ncbi:MAG: D-alanyl-D-alanine carboxypeptidase [Clostridiales bacterium]|nr:D-alanyl-D-alanine carboxypeptidase [Clostridiales bacterium]
MKSITIRKIAVVILAALCAAMCCAFMPSDVDDAVSNEYRKTEVNSSATSMALVDGDTGDIIYSKNCNMRRAPASTTKICTAITVLENYTLLDLPVPIPDEAIGIEGSSLYLQNGEMLTVRDLLYGLMLQSGNDCAVALSIIVGGSVDGFVKMMNETAQKAGCTNTNFMNPHGLHHDEHYTTAKDLCAIAYYAMKNEVFREIVATKRHSTPYHNHEYNRNFPNKNKILFNYEGGNGIKTGFTKKSGRCLVSSATRNGKTYICTVLNCGDMFEECMRLMDCAFARG